MRYLLTLCISLTLGACAAPERNLYEGIKAGNETKRTPNERAMTPSPSYDQYKKEREQK